ncbi:MAG: hypothetical protein CM15mP120_13200 [Pseudomonadota bacterium]|nr:MAG: hypothetical protein CM15mP120_13200 [Pseudomonadota bacterium]
MDPEKNSVFSDPIDGFALANANRDNEEAEKTLANLISLPLSPWLWGVISSSAECLCEG